MESTQETMFKEAAKIEKFKKIDFISEILSQEGKMN